jgi:hypothetical protein
LVRAFAADGLLLALEEAAARTDGRPPPPPITSIGFVTRDRLVALERAIRSYGDNARRHGRTPRIVVCDDSRGADENAAARDALTRLGRELSLEMTYAGFEEKQAFADALARESGVERRLIDFALFDPFGCGQTFGANRNALLLLTNGELVFNADDDTICRPAVASDPREGTDFVAERDPQQLWFFESVEQAIENGKFVDVDVLGEHERLLARPLTSLLAADGANVDLDGACDHMIHALSTGRGRILLTPSGILGDSGLYTPTYLFTSVASRDRFVASEAAYRSALRNRAVLKVVRGTAVAHGVPLGGVFGLDNREPLAPFAPVLRNEDGFFGTIVEHCYDDAYFGYPPYALVHAPMEAREHAPGAHLKAAGEARLTNVLTALVNDGPRATPDGKARVLALGRYLIALASQSRSDFRQAVQAALARFAQRWASRFGAIRQKLGSSPQYWARDIEALVTTHATAVTSSTFWLPVDLRQGRTDDEVAALTQNIVLRFGELLVAWESVVCAAAAARDQVRIALTQKRAI